MFNSFVLFVGNGTDGIQIPMRIERAIPMSTGRAIHIFSTLSTP